MSQFAFELNDELSEPERRKLQEVLPGMAQSLVQLQRVARAERRERLIEMFLGDVPLTPLDVRRAKLQAEARRAVFAGTEWLTVGELGTHAGLGANPSATAGRWREARRIFAIQRNGRDYYPRYALDEDFRPLPAVATVLGILANYSTERLAAWFESTSRFLGGRRPRELLVAEPERVVAAARDAVEAEEHLG